MKTFEVFIWSIIGGAIGGFMKEFLGWGFRWLVHRIVSFTLPPKPNAPTVSMEFDNMAKFLVRLGIVAARSDELDPSFFLAGRRLDYAVNDGEVVSQSFNHLSTAEVVVPNLDPGNTVAVQLFNIDKDGRASEPAELLVTVPAVTPPTPVTLPVPTEPTFVVETMPGT